ncbi:MAG: MBL fold metallo-hydrolase [Sphingobacteriales bacterium]|nr:MAG: MBL fold metallo-hydrolase [Sphingobacteriales bacterium]
MRLYTINAGHFKLDGGAMHGVVPKSMWNKANPADENNMCSWAMRCLLVEHGNYKILIDNGMGTKQDDKFFGYYHPHGDDTVEKSLAAHGFTTDDITDVFLTHLHFDHCGGSIKREGDKLVPAFAKAQYWTTEKHWQSAMNPNEREKASFLKENIEPMQESGQLRFIDVADGEKWLPDFRVRYVNGHTDSMMLPQITFNGTTILFCADLVPSVAHISMPWVMAYDMRPLDTLKEKAQILTQAAEENWVLFFEHDPKVECCTLQKTDRGIRMKETFPLSELEARYPVKE